MAVSRKERYIREVRNDIIEMLVLNVLVAEYNFDNSVTRYYNEKIFKDGILTDKEFLSIAKKEKQRY